MNENAELKAKELGEVNPGYIYPQVEQPTNEMPEEPQPEPTKEIEGIIPEVGSLIPEELGEIIK